MLKKSELIENIIINIEQITKYHLTSNELSNKFDEVIYLTDLQIAKIKDIRFSISKFNER